MNFFLVSFHDMDTPVTKTIYTFNVSCSICGDTIKRIFYCFKKKERMRVGKTSRFV